VQAGPHAGDLLRAVALAQDAREDVRREHVGDGLEDLDERDVGRSLHLVAVAGEGDGAASDGVGHDVLGEARLADAGLAADQGEVAFARRRLLLEAAKVGELVVAADQVGLSTAGLGGGLVVPQELVQAPALGEALEPEEPFENALMTILDRSLGKVAAAGLDFIFETVGSRQLCRIDVQPSDAPVFVEWKDNQLFFVRMGNSTRQFAIAEAIEYIDRRFE
jgi:hypothetical protein